jgi:hypothetical protein
VIRTLSTLESAGFIEIQKHQSPAGHRCNRYQICLSKLNLSGDTMSRPQVTPATVSSDMVSKPPAPPYRKNHQEPTYEPDESVVAEAIASIVDSERELQGEPVRQSLAKTIDSELRSGAEPRDLVRTLLASWRKFSTARSQGKFEIRGWGPANFFAGGWWKREQDWPWKPEFRPERKMRYCDPATLYTGPEYQRRAEGA